MNRIALVCAYSLVACATSATSPSPPALDAGSCGVACEDAAREPPVNEAGVADDGGDASAGDCDACPSTALCIAGACVCPSGLMLCADGCVDTTTDDSDCGACSNACTGGTQCVSSACATPPLRTIVFVSSQVYAGGSFGGLAGADTECQSLASAAALGTPSTFKAWLSDATVDASSRFGHWSTPYVLSDLSTTVANDWTTLTSGTLLHAIDMTESGGSPPTGNMPAAAVWTNTTTTGSAYSKTDCSDWTSTTASVSMFHVGTATESTSAWTLDPSHSYTGNFCGDTAAIYCVGQ